MATSIQAVVSSTTSGDTTSRVSQAEARVNFFSYIEGWYNPARLHSGLSYGFPMT